MERRRASIRNIFIAAAVLGTLSLTSELGLAIPEESHCWDSAKLLAPEIILRREMAGQERHCYEISLAADQFLEVVVRQQGVDVAASLFDPEDQRLLHMDSPNGNLGPERVLLLATASGSYSLEVRSSQDSAEGYYTIEIEALRGATVVDRYRAAGAKLYDDAESERRRGDPVALQRSLEQYLQALDMWKLGGDSWGQALIYYRIGQTHVQLGKLADGLEAYLRSEELYQILDAQHEQAILLTSIGSLYRQSGQLRSAFVAFERALEIFENLSDKLRQARLLNSIARIHASLGEIHSALRTHDRALTIWKELGDDVQQAATLNSIAEVYISLSQFHVAHDILQQVLALRISSKDKRGEIVTLNSLGTVYRRQDNLEPARKCFERALSLIRNLGDRDDEAATLIGLGLTQFRLGELRPAMATYQEALRLARDVKDSRTEAYALINSGWLYDSFGLPREALEYFYPALETLQRREELSGEASALFGIARAERNLRHLTVAKERAEEALSKVEELRSESSIAADQVSYLASKHNYYEFYVELLMQLHEREPDAGFNALALEASERSRARSFLERLAESRAQLRRGSRSELLEREKSLRDHLEVKELERAQLSEVEPAGIPRTKAVEKELRDLVMAYREITARIQEDNPRYTSLIWPSPLSLEVIQKEVLDENTLLLEYFLGEERSFLWLVRHDGLTSRELPGRPRIEALAHQAYLLLTESQKRGARIQTQLVLKALGEMLVAPVADHLGSKRLLIVGSGALHYIPFSALPGADGTSPLVFNHEIVSLPSVSVIPLLRRRREERQAASKVVAVLADPIFGGNDPRLAGRSGEKSPNSTLPTSPSQSFPRLPYTRQEAEAILALVEPDQELGALGSEANLGLVRSGELAQFRILHFSTHSWLHSEHPELSGIVLSLFDAEGRPQPGLLRAYEIYNLRLPAELVVLSACRTAIGQEARGEGLLSLSREFMYAGASRVLVSLWNVNDQATTQLMQRFYHEMLMEKLPPAAALRAAQIAMLESDHWQAPFYWAGFILQGDW